MRRPRRFKPLSAKPIVAACLEALEARVLLSAAFNITGLTQLRGTPGFGQIDGSGIGIAVLDSGADAANPDLSQNVVAFYNAVEAPITQPVQPGANAFDHDGHGSHVSGIAASSNANIGVAFAAKLIEIRVVPDAVEPQLGGDPVLRGLEWVEQHYQSYNIKVVNLSLGEGGVNLDAVTSAAAQDAEAVAIHDLENLGITVVTASGNSYANDPAPGASFPAIVSTISVANTWATSGQPSDFGVPFGEPGDNYGAVDFRANPDTFASTSQRSTLPNQVAAPGEDIYSTWNGTSTDASGTGSGSGGDLLHNTLSGTSMASPFVAGTVALMQDAAQTFGGHYLTPAQCLQIITQTADTLVDSNNPNNARYSLIDGSLSALPETGLTFKRVNVLKAIEQVKALMTGTAAGTGPQPGPDTDNTTADANFVPTLDGTRAFTFGGNVGADGQVLVGNNDVDLYKIDVESPGQMTLTLSLPSGGTAFAAAIRLFDANGNPIGAPVTGTPGSYPTLTTDPANPLPVGTYYVGISGASNTAYHITDGSGATGGTSQGDYSIVFSLLNPDPNGVIQGAVSEDLTDPNTAERDPFNGAQVTDIVNQGALGSDPPPVGGTTRVTVASDVDMFKIVAPDSGQLHLWTDTTAYLFNGADTYLALFDSSGHPLASNDNNPAITGTNQTDSALSYNVQIGGTYYLAVTVPQNSGLDPSNPYLGRTAGATPGDELYDLHIAFYNGDINGTAISPVPATVGSTVTGAIGSDNSQPLLGANGGFKDVDWISYTSRSNGLFDVSISSQTTGFTPVLSLWEFTAGQTNITKIADSSTGSSSELIASVSAGQSFFVAVAGQGNNNFNWFAVASGTGGQTGNYSMVSRLRPASDLPSLTDNSIGAGLVQTITVDGPTLKGNIGMDGAVVVGAADVDFYKLVAPATETVLVRTFTNQEGDADTYLRVFDSAGNQLGADDNIDNTTTASAVRVRLQAAQTYYIGVNGASSASDSYDPLTGANATPGSTGNYVLSVNTSPNSFTVTGPSVILEPYKDPSSVVFTVALDDPLTTTATVDYATVDGTAIAGADYTAVSGTLTFAPGQTLQTVRVFVLPAGVTAGTRNFYLDLSNSQGAPIAVAQGTAAIQEASFRAETFGGKKVATYTDANGGRVTLSLAGAGTGQALFVTGAANPMQIVIDNAAGSVFTVKGKGAILGNVTINGSLSYLNAKGVTLNGDLTITGAAGKILFGSVGDGLAQHAITLGGGTTSLTLGHVVDFTLSTPGALALLAVAGWSDPHPATDAVSATSIAKLQSTGSLDVSLNVGSIGKAQIKGDLAGGTWTITGGAGALAATGTASADWSATFGGDVGTLQLATDSASITARSIHAMKVKGAMSNATLRLTSGAPVVLGSLTVGGAIAGSQVRAVGGIGKTSAGAMSSSDFFAGVADAVTGLPAASSDLVTQSAISSITIKGVFANSNIAASSIGNVSIHSVTTGNGGKSFGIAAHSLRAIVSPPVKWNSKLSPTLLQKPTGDFLVRLLS